jgi:hypothetical protein
VLAVLLFYLVVNWISGGRDKKEDKGKEEVSSVFSMDSLHCYYRGEVIAGCDPKSLEVLSENYVRDADSVFYCDKETTMTNLFPPLFKTTVSVFVIKGADRTSFLSLGYGYAKDKLEGYIKGVAFSVADVASFTVINYYFTKDDKRAYFDANPISGSDGKTFVLLDSSAQGYAKDARYGYFFYTTEVKRIYCDAATFEKAGGYHARDRYAAYYLESKIRGADPTSFEEISSSYSRDDKAVYFEELKIEGVDLATFRVHEGNARLNQNGYYSIDKSNVYWREKKIVGADVATFDVLERGEYSKDKNAVYWNGVKIEGADAASFVTRSDSYIGRDKNHEYLEGKIRRE